jgi:23S rRNA (adenine1618-N6)-methyltransferase
MEQEDNQEAKPNSETTKAEDHVEVSLRFKIDVREGDMEVCWLQGKDSILFESFCGMLKRSMKQK